MNQTSVSPRRRLIAVALALVAAITSGCETRSEEMEQGMKSIVDYGCSSCHTIPGVHRADGAVGPPLHFWAERGYIAGALVNTHDNLMLWLTDPQAIEPGTVMPQMGVTETDASNISTYLYTLQLGDRGHVSVRGHTADMDTPLLHHSGAP